MFKQILRTYCFLDEALFEISNSKWSGTISSLDELYKDRESRRSSRYSHRTRMALKHSHLDSSQAQPLLSTEIADLQPIQIEKYEELEARMNATKKIWHLFNNGNFNVSGKFIWAVKHIFYSQKSTSGYEWEIKQVIGA